MFFSRNAVMELGGEAEDGKIRISAKQKVNSGHSSWDNDDNVSIPTKDFTHRSHSFRRDVRMDHLT